MSARNDGGPAFPRTSTNEDQYGVMHTVSTGGMTLREWFAGQAMGGLMADPKETGSAEEIANAAYAVADAMIAARERDGDA